MHDKKKCAKCMFHAGKPGNMIGVYCNYSGITDRTCIRIIDDKKVDIRGEGECALFEKGVAARDNEYEEKNK